MSVDVFTLSCASLPAAKLVGFRGVEQLCRPFEIDLFFTLPAGTDVRPALGAKATLLADRKDDRGVMAWHGVLPRIRLLHQTEERALYGALLVPRLWLLRHSVRSRVYTQAADAGGGNTLRQFLSDTFQHGGLLANDFEFRVDEASYPKEEFVCQYRESHLDFAHRWLEREGVYYYFEHDPAEGAEEKLVLVDRKGAHEPLHAPGKVRYFPSGSADVTAGEGLFELHAEFQRLPASVLLTDYDYQNPAAAVRGEGKISPTGAGELRDYGYRVSTESEAGRLAAVKAQSIACHELLLQARGNALFLRAGYAFEIEDCPDGLPSKLLAIEVRHAGSISGATAEVRRYTGLDADETYRVEVHAIPADVQFRAPQTTAWPRIYGFENGTVCGEAESPYAQIDAEGRYLVRFKFDASELPDGKASCYVRMMQPHGGSTEGFHFPLRKGTEVMLAFLGGDPDRPFVAGVVHNAQRPSAVTQDNRTKNVIQTGGRNRIEIEDAEGKQYIRMSSPPANTYFHMGAPNEPRNIRLSTDGKGFHNYGDSLDIEIGCGGLKETVHGHVTWVDENGRDDTVTCNLREFYSADHSTHVAGTRGETVTGAVDELYGTLKTVVGGSVTQQFDSQSTRVAGDRTRVIGGAWVESAGSVSQSCGPKTTLCGPWKGSFASWDMHVDGAVTISTPSWKVTDPAGQWNFASVTYSGSKKTEYTALSIGGTGVSANATGVFLRNAGVNVYKLGVESKKKAVKDETAGVESKSGGIMSVLKGLCSFG